MPISLQVAQAGKMRVGICQVWRETQLVLISWKAKLFLFSSVEKEPIVGNVSKHVRVIIIISVFKLFLPLNKYGDPPVLFQNKSFYNNINQSVKFGKNLTAGSIFQRNDLKLFVSSLLCSPRAD